MSFLSEINSKKNNLKPTETVVTRVDGRKFLQTKNSSDVEIAEKCHGFVVDTKPDDVPAKIVDFLYLGSQDCCDLEVLLKYNIRYVLSIGVDAPNKHPFVKQYKFVECLDIPETDITKVLKECNEFINTSINEKRNVLVHCNAGVSRSPTVVLAFLITSRQYTYIEAFDIVKSARNCIRPNDGFQLQLKLLPRF